jgi:hypothetical protein
LSALPGLPPAACVCAAALSSACCTYHPLCMPLLPCLTSCAPVAPPRSVSPPRLLSCCLASPFSPPPNRENLQADEGAEYGQLIEMHHLTAFTDCFCFCCLVSSQSPAGRTCRLTRVPSTTS